MKTADVTRLESLGISASDINSQTLAQLWEKSLFLRRALLGEISVVRTHWRYEEYAPDIDPHLPAGWKQHEWDRYLASRYRPVRVNEFEGYLLTTVGAGDLWTGLVTAGLGTPFNSTNAQCAVGDSNTAATAGQTDLQAAAGTKINAADPSSATNATPIVVSGTFSPSAVVGSDYVLSGFTGAGASAINNTFECSVGGASSMTLLNSAGSGAITVTGGLIKPINYYRQTVNGAPSHSTNQVQFVSVFAANNANFHAQEWCVCTGGGATNLQSQAPPHMLDRVVADNGTKAQGNTATLTVTATLS
jgi:hypothetical protein